MNHITLIGRMTSDAELKITQNGNNYVRFTLAVRRYLRKDNADDEKKVVTDFFPCVAWRRTAEIIAKYCQKGKQVAVSGSLQTYSLEKDGDKRKGFQVNVRDLFLIDNKKPENTEENEDFVSECPVDIKSGFPINEEDIPF